MGALQRQPRPKALRWFLIIAILVVALAILLGLVFTGSSEKQPSIAMSDGTRIHLRDATIGTSHRIGNAVAHFLDELPRTARDPLVALDPIRLKRWSQNTASTSLVVWAYSTSDPPPQVPWVLITPSGAAPSGWSGPAGFSMPIDKNNHRSVAIPPFSAWPRRAEHLDVVFVNNPRTGQRHEIGRSQFSNPRVSTAPHWEAEPLPATQANDQFRLTLRNFFSGIGRSRSERYDAGNIDLHFHSPQSGEEIGAVFDYELRPHANSPGSWSLSGIRLGDATGNSLEGTAWFNPFDSLQTFGPVLWPDEHAWKLSLHFIPKGEHPLNQLLVFEDVSLPSPNSTTILNRNNKSLLGYRVVLESISRTRLPNQARTAPDQLTVTLSHGNSAEDQREVRLMSVEDQESGETIKYRANTYPLGTHSIGFSCPTNNNARLRISYLIRAQRTVEFLVEPNWDTDVERLYIYNLKSGSGNWTNTPFSPTTAAKTN